MPDTSKSVRDLQSANGEAWPPTLKFFDWAERQRATLRETFVETLQKDLKLSKSDISELVAGIIQTRIGSRIVGRHGSKTRIRWHYSLKSIAHVARGGAQQLEAIEEGRFTPAASRDL